MNESWLSVPSRKPAIFVCLKDIFLCPTALNTWFASSSAEGPIFFHWYSHRNLLPFILAYSSGTASWEKMIFLFVIPDFWVWFKALGLTSFWLHSNPCSGTYLRFLGEGSFFFSKLSVMFICAPTALKHFISWQVDLSRYWYFSVSALWDLLSSCWKCPPSS